MSRPRAYIRYPDKLAAALAVQLPKDVRDDLRARKVPAREVLCLFHTDHIILHALDGSDEWWNLDHKLVPEHLKKSRDDTRRVGKVRRLSKKGPALQILAERNEAAIEASLPAWPKRKRKIRSRGFDKRHRPLRSRGFQRRQT